MPVDSVVALEAGAAIRPDDGRMTRPGRKHQPVARGKLDRLFVRTDQEGDRALGADEQLRGSVFVRRVPIARTVAPRVWLDAGGLKSLTRGLDACLPRFERLEAQSTKSAARWINTSPSSRATPTIRSSGRSHGRISVS